MVAGEQDFPLELVYALVVVVVIVENSGISNSFCMLCGVPPDPTNGFTNVALTEYNFELQKPYDIPLEQRYSYYNGVRKLWVYVDDKPHDPTRPSLIHGATNYTTTIILRIYNGDMRYYSGDLVDTDLYDKWFRVNLIHDVYKRNLTVFIDVKLPASGKPARNLSIIGFQLCKQNMEISHKNSLLFLVLVGFSAKLVLFCSTDGFTLAPLTEKNFWLQKPYNVPLDNRYSYEDEVRRLWVYNHDKPFYDDSGTRPAQKGHDYSSGVWQFEGYFYVPKGTSGVTIMQVHGAKKGATTLKLRIYDGDMRYYRFEAVDTDLYDK
ncbi:unnamed protein product [Camellia sinensis]